MDYANKKKTRLKKMKITSVDMVHRGANQESWINLYKSDTPPDASGVPGSDEIPQRVRDGLLVLFFEGEGGRAVEAMEAKLLARQPDTLDQCLYRVEFQ